MWNKPHLLNAIADLLMLVAAAALLAVAAVWLVRVPSLPVREVVFAEALPHTRRGDVEQVLPAALKGNFFSLNLEAVRGALEKLPWVRKVEVRRVWPARLSMCTQSPSAMPRSAASSGWMSSRSSLCHTVLAVRRVWAPTLYWLRIRPVVRISGNRRVERSVVGT